EARDVRDDAGTAHPGLKVFELEDVVPVLEGHELVARIAAGFLELLQDVLEGEVAQLPLELLVFSKQLNSLADKVLDLLSEGPGARLEHGVTLGVDSRVVERVLAL